VTGDENGTKKLAQKEATLGQSRRAQERNPEGPLFILSLKGHKALREGAVSRLIRESENLVGQFFAQQGTWYLPYRKALGNRVIPWAFKRMHL
jgi:hypothetical protein